MKDHFAPSITIFFAFLLISTYFYVHNNILDETLEHMEDKIGS